MKIFKSVLVLSVLLTMLVACGDDSSSSVSPEPAGDSSSSINQSSSGNLQSSSSKGSKKSSSSVTEKKSSSSEQGYSSVSSKNSSSSVIEQSSSSMRRRCEEGSLDTMVVGNMVGYYECRNNTWELVSYVELSSSSISSSDAHYDMTEQYLYQDKENTEKMTDDFVDPRDQHVYKTFLYQKEKNGEFLYRLRIFANNLNYG